MASWNEFYSSLSGNPNVDMNKIYRIESSNNPDVSNRSTGAVGLGQITPVVLKEWNQFNKKEQYGEEDLFDEDVNKKISTWYMNKRIPQMLAAKRINDTLENRLISYNWGVGNVGKSLPKETANYIHQYRSL